MNETLTWIGSACVVVAFLSLLAGAGWWKVSVALIVSAAVAAAAGIGVGWVAWRVGLSFDHGGGEWNGFGAFMIALFTVYGVAAIVFLVMMITLAVTRRSIFRRSRASWGLLGLGAVSVAASAGAFTLNTPRYASGKQLALHIEQNWNDPEAEAEIVRRGPAVVPVILAELQRLAAPSAEGYPRHNVPPLLRMLGLIGGDGVNAELHRWTGRESEPPILVAAVRALAERGDQSALPIIVEHLKTTSGEWPSHHPDLLRALGTLRAAGQIATIRDVLAARTAGSTPMLVQSGVEALATIGTVEAWAVIAELCADNEPSRRSEALEVLQKIPGPRTVALAGKALGDPEARVRESAYWLIYRVEPKLLEGMPYGWSEDNGRKLREALDRQNIPNP